MYTALFSTFQWASALLVSHATSAARTAVLNEYDRTAPSPFYHHDMFNDTVNFASTHLQRRLEGNLTYVVSGVAAFLFTAYKYAQARKRHVRTVGVVVGSPPLNSFCRSTYLLQARLGSFLTMVRYSTSYMRRRCFRMRHARSVISPLCRPIVLAQPHSVQQWDVQSSGDR